MIGAVDDGGSGVGIDVGIVEEAKTEFGGEDFGDSAIDIALWHDALFHLPEEGVERRAVGEVVVDAGGDGLTGCVGVVGGDVVGLPEHLDAVAVGGDESLETPLLAEHAIEEPMVDVGGNAVNFVVGGHDAADVGFLDHGFEGDEEVFANDAFGVVAGGGVRAAFGLAVNGKVLSGGDDVVAADGIIRALQAGDDGDAHAGDEEGIFAIGFLGAAPAGTAGEVEDGGEDLVDAARAGFVAGGGEDLMDEGGIPGGREAQGLREAGAAAFHKAVERFALEEGGDAEARFLELVALDGVAQDCGVARGDGEVDAVGLEEDGAGLVQIVGAGGVDDAVESIDAAADLLNFFFESEAGEQVSNALVHSEFGIAIRSVGVGRGGRVLGG